MASPGESLTSWHLQRCDGFLDLGMREQARAELAAVPEKDRNATPFLRMMLRLQLEDGNWTTAAQLAETLAKKEPGDPSFPIQLAYATRRSSGIEAAEKILRDALTRFPKIALIHFNLACYACQTDRRDDALTCLAKAAALDPGLLQTAMEDEDLRPIWPFIEA